MTGSCQDIIKAIHSGALDKSFIELYGVAAIAEQKLRYLQLLQQLANLHPEVQALLVSAPGRTELGGNHTDHNNGNVLAAAVDLDCIAAVTPTDTPEIMLTSDEYPSRIQVDLSDLTPRESEYGKAEALVRGMAALFSKETGKIGGFIGHLSATCRPGTGLSSSAAFSVLIGGICNFLYGGGALSAEKIAQLAQKAENMFFGKPCGLMDQMSSSVGGTLAIDFMEPQDPQINRINMPTSAAAYRLLVIDTGSSHIELTADYAAVPQEIHAAAAVMGKQVARGLTFDEVITNLPRIREKAGDRAALRLLHFIGENDRAVALATALGDGNFSRYLELVKQSGESSAMLLQNCAPSGSSHVQGILLALALTKHFSPAAVARVHGGGFAGTIQVYLPKQEVECYTRRMEQVFGKEAVIPLLIGRPGVTALTAKGLLRTRCECGGKDAATYNH